MSQPVEPFAASFDAIDPDRSGISRAAFDHAFTQAAQRTAVRKNEPGFYLLDDADGRFVVDHVTGVISLASSALLEGEHGAVHDVRLHVVEQSGSSYELPLQLRVTGLIPSMVGAEDIDFSGAATAPAPELPARRQIALVTSAPPAPQIGWTSYSAVRCETGKAPLLIADAPFATSLEPLPMPSAPGPFRLHLFTPLPAVSALGAVWSL